MMAILKLTDICKDYQQGKEPVRVLKNISLTVEKGDYLAIMGPSGSGKTTLMNMIAGIYYPDSGQIFVDGKEASIHSPREAFDYRIGMIHQHFKLVDVFTAAENIILGLEDEDGYPLIEARELKVSE